MKGKRINERYKLIRPVGGGGMADVYLAKDLILDRLVAVKILKPHFSEDDEFIRRFHREAESAASLSHEHIVSIYDVGEENGLYYIVMEYVEGQTLKEYIQTHGPLRVEETVRILKQMTEAVRHAHENQIIHRDVKPQNILMSINGTAKVTDFGIARAISEATITHTNSVLGSVHYLSPEQARGGRVTYKSDLYALGIIAYEMLTGHVPFSGDTAVAIALKHLQDPLPSLREIVPDVPRSIDNMVARLTAKDPDNRFDSAEELLIDLQTVLYAERENEAPVQFNEDEEKTKGIPVIGPEIEAGEDTMAPPVKGEERGREGRKKGPSRSVIWGVLASILVLGALLIAIAILPRLLQVDEVTVPDVNGLPAEEAASELEDLDLEVSEEYREDEELASDQVIAVRPEAGTNVKVGSSVTLVISSSDQEAGMINVLGLTQAEAEEALSEYGSVNITLQESEEEPDDTVVSQAPEPGTDLIPADTDVELTISERPVFTMSNLYGMSREEVETSLSDESYVELSFEEEYHPVMEEGSVFAQEPSRGTEITQNTTVEVTLSRGPAPEETAAENEQDGASEEVPDSNAQNEGEASEEEEMVSAMVPFAVEVPERSGEERPVYDIQILVIDAENSTAEEMINEEITESTEFQVPMSVNQGDTAQLLLYVNGNEFSESPYDYTYEEVERHE
ncbi:Stk1 family PASTA domain-containing Ser/Thr kinase [Alkalicoccus halolimnae]|uniref:Serine/threonine-protein kinase PrkC n=1 Tax=Alkalicoccus halolimnae TaxID=1667239 RepID=A0A5C7FJ76_9BACI|nr:Stk1 family PASTA domain-containing Ser/Thr kinase [Alkalicoccus halolimnae]TXF87387.1 Stk1 family PASTA domain-containing Ser/Thr kinase [Alkalicoccus halolimnae]